MDNRLYFIAGDLAANIAAGAVVAWLTWVIVEPGWNMFVTMCALMAFGMLVGVILSLPLGILFGAMEVMVPVMLTSMLSAMFVSMRASMMSISALEATVIGSAIGCAAIVAVWLLNSRLRGPVDVDRIGVQPHD